MAKTLLQLTQNILSAMDSDEVNSIYDTVEAVQVATIVLETLEAEFSNIDLPEFRSMKKLEALGDPAHPNYLRYGHAIDTIRWLRYRNERNHGMFQEVHYLKPDDFFERLLNVTGTGAYTQKVTDFSGVSYYITNNKAPTFYTSVDNNLLIFDSYDLEAEVTLQQTNSFVLSTKAVEEGQMDDDFVPSIPDHAFPLLLAESKATCFITLKQMASPKSEQIARRQRSRVQNNMYKSQKAGYPYASSRFNYARNR
jgi:hypothetical protein